MFVPFAMRDDGTDLGPDCDVVLMTLSPAPSPPLPADRLAMERERHGVMLALTVAAFLLLLVLEVRPEGKVGVAGMESLELPEACLSRRWFGIECPGCGMTRSLVSLVHGDFAAAWRYHRLGWVIGLAAVVQAAVRIAALRSLRHGRILNTRWLDPALLGLMLLLLVSWGFRQFGL